METKLWKCSSDGKDEIVSELIREKNIPRAVALYLASRGITASGVDLYFNGTMADLSDPFRFPGMEEAVRRLWQAVRTKENILIHGDYDTDGITATALLTWVLERHGGSVFSFLPHRFDDGYGFTPESLTKALDLTKAQCSVLVTVDCGINSADAVSEAKKRGIDVIITDHHEPAEDLPDAAMALINPKVHECVADLCNLSGVGVAFKLAHAFLRYGRLRGLIPGDAEDISDICEVLDFVALGTIADIVPILGENRILVKYGMGILKKQLRPGVRALIDVAHVNTARMHPSDVTFKLAPRLNAAGRLGNAITALQLMMAPQIVDAYQYANALEKFNQQRQAKEQEIFLEAKKQVESDPGYADSVSIMAAGENWHQGVIGIVASRFARDYNRPAIVLTIQGDEAHGSGRSAGGLNLIQILSKSAHLLTRFGGHPMAVGLGLPKDKIAEFKKEFEENVRSAVKPSDLVDSIEYDGILYLRDLDDNFFRYYELMGPFGHGNPQPVYQVQSVEVIRTFGIKPGHTRGIMRDQSGETFDFIAFNRIMDPHTSWDIMAVPQINEYYGEKRRQLQIIDAHPLY